MFGQFECSCGNTWGSGYAWMEWDKGEKEWMDCWQKCRSCRRETYQTYLEPLKDESQKPHNRANCEMCQKYGDCRYIRTSKVEWDYSSDEEDFVSRKHKKGLRMK